jgi:hypothetical protein
MQIKKNDYAFDICNWRHASRKTRQVAIYVIKLGYVHLGEPTICNKVKKYKNAYKTMAPGPVGEWRYEFIMRQL